MCVEVFCNSFVRSVTNKIKHQLDTQKNKTTKTIKLSAGLKLDQFDSLVGCTMNSS